MAKKTTSKKTARKTRRKAAGARKRLTPRKDKRGLDSGEIALGLEAREVAPLAARIESAGGAASAAYREPLSGRPLLLASLLFGLTIGAVFMLQGLLVADMFGIPSYGTVFGALNLITGIGGGLGPLAIGLLADGLGGYAPALRTLLVIAPISAVVVWQMRHPEP